MQVRAGRGPVDREADVRQVALLEEPEGDRVGRALVGRHDYVEACALAHRTARDRVVDASTLDDRISGVDPPGDPRQEQELLRFAEPAGGATRTDFSRPAEHEELIDDGVLVHPAAVVLARDELRAVLLVVGAERDVLAAAVDRVLHGLSPPLDGPFVVVLQCRDEELGADRDRPLLALADLALAHGRVRRRRDLDRHEAPAVVVDLPAEDGVAGLQHGHHGEVRPRA